MAGCKRPTRCPKRGSCASISVRSLDHRTCMMKWLKETGGATLNRPPDFQLRASSSPHTDPASVFILLKACVTVAGPQQPVSPTSSAVCQPPAPSSDFHTNALVKRNPFESSGVVQCLPPHTEPYVASITIAPLTIIAYMHINFSPPSPDQSRRATRMSPRDNVQIVSPSDAACI